MSSYIYSAKNNAFYPLELEQDYRQAQTWPDDATEVPDNLAAEFMGVEPDGKYRIPGASGLPEWKDVPPLTQEELIAIADAEKSTRIAEAGNRTQVWQTQLMLGMITDNDKTALKAWMQYIQALQSVDTSAAPDVLWPVTPA